MAASCYRFLWSWYGDTENVSGFLYAEADYISHHTSFDGLLAALFVIKREGKHMGKKDKQCLLIPTNCNGICGFDFEKVLTESIKISIDFPFSHLV